MAAQGKIAQSHIEDCGPRIRGNTAEAAIERATGDAQREKTPLAEAREGEKERSETSGSRGLTDAEREEQTAPQRNKLRSGMLIKDQLVILEETLMTPGKEEGRMRMMKVCERA